MDKIKEFLKKYFGFNDGFDLRIVRFDSKGNCQFVYFNWSTFKFETTCWANSLQVLFGKTSEKKHLIIGLWNY